MRNSQIFILPSLYEGLPLVVLEALACGCTVIATDLPGTREIKNRLETNRLILIEKPTQLCSDASLPADEERFIDALHHSLENLLSQPRVDNDSESKLSYFSWASVFSRVQESWFNMLNELDVSCT
jgi:glycosyltransferase involved in cell wall biosynthesis